MGSGATMLRNVHFDFLVPLGIALSNNSTYREDQFYSALGQHLGVALMGFVNVGCAAASSVRTIAAGRQPLLHPAHIDPTTASDRDRWDLSRPDQVKTKPIRQTCGRRELRDGD